MSEDKKNPGGKTQLFTRAEKYFTEDIWNESGELQGPSSWRLLLRFGTQVVHGFGRHRLPVRAAALSYTTLLALVPLLAVAFAVAKSFWQRQAEQNIPQLLNQLVNLLAPQLRDLRFDARSLTLPSEPRA